MLLELVLTTIEGELICVEILNWPPQPPLLPHPKTKAIQTKNDKAHYPIWYFATDSFALSLFNVNKNDLKPLFKSMANPAKIHMGPATARAFCEALAFESSANLWSR